MKRRKSAERIVVKPPEHIDYGGFSFDITHRDPSSKARLATLTTPHGAIQTPNFIFCGTKASIKNISPQTMVDLQTDIILANTYHLMLQPGPDIIEKMGGLHEFTQWKGPMMTDSGGFQVFSMGHGSVADEIKGRNTGQQRKNVVKITEKGANFQSYWDGRKIELTPEMSMDIQRKLGADLIYQFDECTPFHVDKVYTEDLYTAVIVGGIVAFPILKSIITIRKVCTVLYRVAYTKTFVPSVAHGLRTARFSERLLAVHLVAAKNKCARLYHGV